MAESDQDVLQNDSLVNLEPLMTYSHSHLVYSTSSGGFPLSSSSQANKVHHKVCIMIYACPECITIQRTWLCTCAVHATKCIWLPLGMFEQSFENTQWRNICVSKKFKTITRCHIQDRQTVQVNFMWNFSEIFVNFAQTCMNFRWISSKFQVKNELYMSVFKHT